MEFSSFAVDAFRGAVLLGAVLGASWLMRGATASVRRAMLVSMLTSVLAVPFAARALSTSPIAHVMEVPIFVRPVSIDPLLEAHEPPPVASQHAASSPKPSAVLAHTEAAWRARWPALLLATWALGVVVVLARLVFGLWGARRLVARAHAEDAAPFADVAQATARQVGARAAIAVSDDVGAPAVAGLFAPTILMPRKSLQWSCDEWRLVLLHELAHVRRRDCLAAVLADLVCAMHWFDPLAWMARAKLRRERERAADEDVLRFDGCASDYAELLLAVAFGARSAPPAGALGMTAGSSGLAERIEAIVGRGRRGQVSRTSTIAIASAACALSLAMACAHPRASAQPGKGEEGAARAAAPSELGSRETLAREVSSAIDVPMANLELTIDSALQLVVDEELARLLAEYRPAAATVVVLEPSKGELLAIGDATTARRAFVTGSTLKTMTFAVALDAGAVRVDQKFDCRTRSFGAHRLADAKEHDQLDLAQILEVSSNVGASRIFEAMDRERFDEALARFHLSDVSKVQLAGVAQGSAPKTTSLDAYTAAAFASGEVLTATPLQMAAAYAVFANGGEYVAPTLVRKGDPAKKGGVPTRERVLRAETAGTIMQLLERAVRGEHATGKRAQIEGVRVAGKTGTAGWSTPDGKEHAYASFIGVVPADAPRYVILVGAVDPRDGAGGGTVAAPTFAKIAARALAR
jgi:beta-lactamase regulating signal transducer with metallopeptidase domain